MAAEGGPEALARLLDAAERPRVGNWSLRAALTRYAQPQPRRASAVIELLRRVEFALRPHAKLLERDGAAVWSAVAGDDPEPADDHVFVVEVLRALTDLDRLGDVLAAWAVAGGDGRPDAEVDGTVADLTARLEALGVEREERPPPPRGGRRG